MEGPFLGWSRRLAAATLITAVAAGCGGSDAEKPAPQVSDDQRGVLTTIDELQAASRQGDAAKICGELFAPALAKSIETAAGRSCQQEISSTLTTPDAQYSVQRQIKVNGKRATVTAREQTGKTSTLFLVRDDVRWRIERIQPVKSQ